MDLKAELLSFFIETCGERVSLFFLAMLPIFELRLAIPLGIIKFTLPVVDVFIFSFLGNIAVIAPLLFFFKSFFHALENLPLFGKIFRWWFRRVEKKSRIVSRWGFWGLVFFVAIPLPGTGAWTGSVAATLFEIKTKKAFLAIVIGVLIAGILVTILSLFFDHRARSWILK